jgi:hypothetical protein
LSLQAGVDSLLSEWRTEMMRPESPLALLVQQIEQQKQILQQQQLATDTKTPTPAPALQLTVSEADAHAITAEHDRFVQSVQLITVQYITTH